jgi:outer membrane immunogenic protein
LPITITAQLCAAGVAFLRQQQAQNWIWYGSEVERLHPIRMREESAMRKLLLSAAMSLVMVAGASAADYSDAPPAWSWAGFYFGANGGYALSTSRDQLALAGDQPTGLYSTGGFGGGQVGYNVQISRWVLGVEADFQSASIGDAVNDLNFGDYFSSQLSSFGTVRGRVGIAFNPLLVYFTGGFAYGNLASFVNGPFLVGAPYSFSGIATGYAVGAGVEYALDRSWSVKAEYLYLNFGKNDPTSAAGPYSQIFGGGSATVNNDAFNAVRIGINYRFGGAPIDRNY